MEVDEYTKMSKVMMNYVLVHGGDVTQKILKVLVKFIKEHLAGKLAFFAHVIGNN